MRTVAKFQFQCSAENGAEVNALRVIHQWRERKFLQSKDGDITILRSGVPALVEQQSEDLDDLRLTEIKVLEPVSGGELMTTVRLLESPTKISFQCILSVGSNGDMSPPNISIRSPRFIRDIISLPYSWCVSNTSERVFNRNFPVHVNDYEEFEELLTSPNRRLPIVAVSELNGQTLAGDLHEQIGNFSCGLAHTIRLSTEASWELTRRLGREWSCFNGAVRLFWPFRPDQNFRTHPLWTFDQILFEGRTEALSRDRFVAFLSQKLIEASTFTADDRQVVDFEAVRLRRITEVAGAAAANSGNFEALADAYAVENDALRKKVADQKLEIEDLRQNVEALIIAERAGSEQVGVADRELPPETVSEAVSIARRDLAGSLLIAPESEKEWLNLNQTAGPPEKILRYLRTLGRLSNLLASGQPLGDTIPIWLGKNGLTCSIDSQTSRRNRADRAFRTRIINGEMVECEYHAKPSDGTSPDMCVRIYFGIVDVAPRVRVGYIGRHLS
ncbi:hypothetical protein [Falsiroseomonas sp. E2-1-a20]|uniref:hypothetical protein n=1 Tax=Falsiroseomonas sp. E2-1-a20 TaxID=3239300 RepID=UPI003F417C7E